MIVTTAHLYSVPGFDGRPGFCARGARAWCEQHGIDWWQFVQHGVDADILIATGDAMALRLVAHAEAMEAERG